MELGAVEGWNSSSKSRFRSFGRMEKSSWKNGARSLGRMEKSSWKNGARSSGRLERAAGRMELGEA
jgi:hypothetical protein